MSGKEPTESKRDDYRHAHQDIRLSGQNVKSWAQRRDAAHDDDLRHGRRAPSESETLGFVATQVVESIADHYAKGEGYTPPPMPDLAEAMIWRMKLNKLIEAVDLAGIEIGKNPSDENYRAAMEAEKAVWDFQYAPDSPFADPQHARHREWVERQAARKREEQYDKSAPSSAFVAPPPPRYVTLAAMAAGKAIAPMPTSIDILAGVGITATPTAPVENFTDIWCVFVDRDQLDFIGTNRNESRVEIALTLHAAFQTMIRMSGYSEEVLEASGINLDDPCLETLATFLNERTNDHYSFGPYETSIDERLFNFLQ